MDAPAGWVFKEASVIVKSWRELRHVLTLVMTCIGSFGGSTPQDNGFEGDDEATVIIDGQEHAFSVASAILDTSGFVQVVLRSADFKLCIVLDESLYVEEVSLQGVFEDIGDDFSDFPTSKI